MNEKKMLEGMLVDIDKKIMNKEDNVRGSICALGVGVLGTVYGVLSKSESHAFSGLIVSGGSFLCWAINSRTLNKLEIKKHVYSLVLRVMDDDYEGKHFRK